GRAAQRLHVVRPALSKQIGGLERELGFDLFDRSHGVKLTAAGEVFYEEVRPILQQADRAVQSIQQVARGEPAQLNIGFITPALWTVLPATLRAYRHDHPHVRLRIHELPGPEQMANVRDGSFDVGFVRGMAVDDILVFEPVWREQYMLALSDEHRLAGCDAIDLAELKGESFVVMP